MIRYWIVHALPNKVFLIFATAFPINILLSVKITMEILNTNQQAYGGLTTLSANNITTSYLHPETIMLVMPIIFGKDLGAKAVPEIAVYFSSICRQTFVPARQSYMNM